MTATLGNLVYYIRTNDSDFKQKAKEIDSTLRAIGVSFTKHSQEAKNYGKSITDSLDKARQSIQQHKETLQSMAVTSGAVFALMITQSKKGIDELVKLQNALTGLRSVAKGTGQDVGAATKAAESLAADGLMTVTDAAIGLKNLLASGYGLDQAIILMNRFKDSAAFGRQGALSFGQAITSATEGIKNGNSILVDNAGVTKNLSVMLKEAGYSQNDLMKATSDSGIRMAIFNGIVRETRHQVGDAAKLSEQLGGQLSKTSANVTVFYQALGSTIEGPLTGFLNKINEILPQMTEWINKNKELVGSLLLITTGSAGAVLAISAIVLAIDKIIAIIKSAVTIISGAKIVFAFQAWAGGAATAAEAVGFLASAFAPFLVGAAIVTGLALIINHFVKIRREAKLAATDIKNVNDLAELQKIEDAREEVYKRKQSEIKSYSLEFNTPYQQLKRKVTGEGNTFRPDYSGLEAAKKSYEEAKAKRQALEKELAKGVNPDPDPYVDPGDKFDVAKRLKQLRNDLEDVDEVAMAFGNTSQIAADKAKLYEEAAIDLAKNGIDPTSSSMGNLVDIFRQYSQISDVNTQKIKNQAEASDLLSEAQEKVAEMSGESMDSFDSFIKKLQDAADENGVLPETKKQIEEIIKKLQQLKAESDANIFKTEIKDNLSEAIKTGFEEKSVSSAVESFTNYLKDKLYKSVADALAEAIMNSAVGQQATDWLRNAFGLFNGSGGTASSNLPGNYGIEGRASGGLVSAGSTYLVGENGPELLTMGSNNGHITPNDQMGGLKVSVNVINKGQSLKTTGQNMEFDGKQYIISVVTEAASTNKGGFRDILQGGAG